MIHHITLGTHNEVLDAQFSTSTSTFDDVLNDTLQRMGVSRDDTQQIVEAAPGIAFIRNKEHELELVVDDNINTEFYTELIKGIQQVQNQSLIQQ